MVTSRDAWSKVSAGFVSDRDYDVPVDSKESNRVTDDYRRAPTLRDKVNRDRANDVLNAALKNS